MAVAPPASFDFIVIGGGSAGYAAARTAHSLGLSVAVVDGAAELGGLCILRGCMPSKTLIESADRNLTIRRAAEFGLRAEAHGADIRAIRDRKRRLIADFAAYRQGQLADGRFTLIRGHARFVSPHEVEITSAADSGGQARVVSGRSYCIATGSVAGAPPIEGLAETGYWTSDEVLDAGNLPESFAILGGGAIALEVAHYLEGVGRRVAVIQRSRHFLSGIDPRCSEVVEHAYRDRGIDCFLGTHIERIARSGRQKTVHFLYGEDMQTCTVTADEIILAMGRQPATGGLGLAAAGVAMQGPKVVISGTMQTSCPHIFAAGDVCSRLDVVHVAIQQAEVAARNAHRLLTGGTPDEEMDYRLLLFGVFSHPQVASVGAGEKELTDAGIPFVSGSHGFDDHGKAMCMGETEGFVKMLAHRETGEILGAVCAGPHGTELIHEVVVAMHYRATVQQFATIPHYHPTLSEIWTYPAEECAGQIGAATE